MTPGTKLGSYDILSQSGAGGMGEVYRGRDPKVGRDVAIKVLPEAFARDGGKSAPRVRPRIVTPAAVVTLVALLLAVAPQVLAQQRNVDDFFRDFTDDWVRHDPNQAAATHYFSGDEQDQLERQLTPVDTREWQLDRLRRAKQGLAELAKFDRAQMTDAQRLSADLMQWQLGMVVRSDAYRDYMFPIEQFQGANISLVSNLTVRRTIATPRDAENYLAALGQVRARMTDAMNVARREDSEHIIPPRFILQATIKQMEEFIAPAPAQNTFVTVYNQKMMAVTAISPAQRQKFRTGAEKIVGEQIYPVWKEAISLLQSQIPKATDDAGLWRLKGGDQAYANELRQFTTTNLTAEQIHEIGLQRVKEIEAQMDGILRIMGRNDGTVQQRIDKLRQEMSYPNTTSEESRNQIMVDINGIISDAQKRSAALFDEHPRAPVVAQPYPAFREANAASTYAAPAPDGSRPGIFQFPRRPDKMTKFGLRSEVYHETVPGHHFQIGLEVENNSLPRFRQIGAFGGISAFVEGWGLYAEHLASESGWYDGDPAGLLGQLNFELFRARRLVVDTGIHAEHWTRQQAIDYGIEPSEVERYVVFPGQACSYMIGELKIIELREKTKKALGDKFSLNAFHDVVLNTGTVPLDLLQAQVEAYIRSASGKP
jgi:uncharacterized protein (DUF885 family)